MTDTDFLDKATRETADAFMKRGWHRQAVDDVAAFQRILAFVQDHMRVTTGNANAELTRLHDILPVSALNDFRLSLFRNLNAEDWFRPAFYRLAKNALSVLVGNELSMQKRVNLSIQMPTDTTSVLPVHADTWSGDSAFEIVVWLPLVDVTDSMSMFLATPESAGEIAARFGDFSSVEQLYQALAPDLQQMEMKQGEVLLFNQQLPHGNRVNETGKTRWSLNCRFKSVWSPVADKKTGEFFEPVTLKPMTRLGADYTLPRGNSS